MEAGASVRLVLRGMAQNRAVWIGVRFGRRNVVLQYKRMFDGYWPKTHKAPPPPQPWAPAREGQPDE